MAISNRLVFRQFCQLRISIKSFRFCRPQKRQQTVFFLLDCQSGNLSLSWQTTGNLVLAGWYPGASCLLKLFPLPGRLVAPPANFGKVSTVDDHTESAALSILRKYAKTITLHHCIKSHALIESQNGKMCRCTQFQIDVYYVYANWAPCNQPRRKEGLTDRNRIPPIATSQQLHRLSRE